MLVFCNVKGASQRSGLGFGTAENAACIAERIGSQQHLVQRCADGRPLLVHRNFRVVCRYSGDEGKQAGAVVRPLRCPLDHFIAARRP